jgi:translocation and assembly module TamA
MCCGLALLSASSGAHAADPQNYSVAIDSNGSDAVDQALRDSALLVALRTDAPVPPFGLITRARGDLERLTTAINSFGYYQPKIAITIAGLDIADPDLPPLLDTTPQDSEVAVRIAVETGPLYRLGTITVDGDIPTAAKDEIRLEPGDPAVAADIIAAQGRILASLQEQSYALAQVPTPIARVDDTAHLLNIVFNVTTGPKVDVGRIAFEGLDDVDEAFARRIFRIEPGAPYKPSAIEAGRQELIATGVFSGVSVRAAEAVSDDGRLPLVVAVEERPAHAVNLTGTYATDLGFNLSVSWSHRNLLGRAEQLNLRAAGTGLWGSATDDIGYQLSAQFVKPLFLRPDQTLDVNVSAVKQDLTAYKQRAESLGGTVHRKLSPQWTVGAGSTIMRDAVAQKGVSRIYQLLTLPLTATYDSTGTGNALIDPTKGMRASFAVTPAQAFGARNLTFITLQAAGSAYFDFSGDGRSVLALRALMGSVLGASNLDLPPDQRLYAGGAETVRGYRYQSIGPKFADGDPMGGTAVDAVGAEFRQRLLGDFGAVAFVDAGQASAAGVPFTGTLRVGAGTGLRYYTPIGAVRADIAVPLKRIRNGDSFEIYIGLGQTF